MERSWLRALLVAGAGAAAAAALARTPALRSLDLWTSDHQQRLIAPAREFTDTVIVVIDDESIARLQPIAGAWPYGRDLFARVTDYLVRAGARAVVLDILFTEPRAGDAELAATLRRGAPVALAAVATPFAIDRERDDRARTAAIGWRADPNVPARTWQDVALPLPQFVEHAAIGIATLVPDEDGVVRRVPAVNRIGAAVVPALPLAARFAQRETRPTISAPRRGRLRIGDEEWPVDANGDIALLFPRVPYRTTQVSFARLAEAALDLRDDDATRALFRDRTVFIGATALLIGDVNETPMGRVPGVVLAAHTYLALTNHLVLEPRWWPWTLALVLLTLAAPVAARVWRSESLAMLTAATGLGLIIAWSGELALLAWLRQPASALTAWLASVSTFVLFLTEKIRALRVTRQRLTSERLAAERTTQLKSEFLAHVSHELRTPLTAILGFSRVLAEEPTLAPDKRVLVQIVRRNGEQLLWLVNNLLDQARIAAGQMSIEARPTAVAEVVEQVLATLAGVPRRPGVRLESSCGMSVPSLVEVDGHRLQQIVINLAANALKFTEQGRVHVAVEWQEGRLEVTVDDTGPGMPPELLEHIFEAFHQADAAHARGGTGLGLTISRNLARLMGGDLTVRSTVGEGSTFRLRVPAARIERAAVQPAPRSLASAPGERLIEAGRTPAVALAGGSPRLRALVADDSEDIRALLQIYLKQIGFDSMLVENGRLAVEMALAERPDVVLMDVQMPEMSGPDAVQAMRRAGFTNSVVALTAGSGEQLEHELLEAGFSAVVFKPVTGDELTNALVQLLGLTTTGAARGGRA